MHAAPDPAGQGAAPDGPALLLIDMQKGMSWAPAETRNQPGAEAVMQVLLQAWRSAGAPVVHVRHLSRDPASPFWPGQEGAEFQASLAPLPRELVVDKHVADAFAAGGLERQLRVRGIEALVVVGVSTNISVESTARSAACLGFQVQVVADACFAFARADQDGVARTAQQVHAMSLANLHGEFARVIDAVQALRLVQADTSLQVRPCDPEQPEAVALLRASDAYMAALYPSESNHLVEPAELKRGNTLFLGAFDGARLVGCGAVRVMDDEGRYGEIKRMFVLLQARGRGVARAILAQLERHLLDSGVTVARLETGIHQPEALALYRRLGFRERAPFGQYRPDPLSLFMEKQLTAGDGAHPP